jgi:uncharacterized protein (DUF885 family)
MISIRRIAVTVPKTGLLVTLLALAGCGQGEGVAPAVSLNTSGPAVDESAQLVEHLNIIYEEYFDKVLELNPTYATFLGQHQWNDRYPNSLGPEHRAAMRALWEEYLDRVNMVDASQLEGQDLLNLEMFRNSLDLSITGDDIPGHLMPINQFRNPANSFVRMGSGASSQPFNTVEDYDNFLGRIDGFVVLMEQAQTNMREGMETGYVQPRILMEKVIPQLESQLVENVEDSAFYRPVANMPESFSEEDRSRLTDAYVDAIGQQIIPAFASMRDFIRDEYLAAARESHGLDGVPNGDEIYAFMVMRTTTTSMSPAEIHELGLSEVARIQASMQSVMDEVGFEGELTEFFEYLNTDDQFYFDEGPQLIEGYYSLRNEVHEKAMALFHKFPKADYEIRAVEPFREKSAAGGSYMRASPDGSRPGVFYANTYDIKARPKWAMESLFLHEAIPGHHFQGALTLEIEGLPTFRKFGRYTAYSEGWGLYAESLGKEMGMYYDPYQYFGALNAELWRAIRLVVDTGLHSKGWTRDQVLEYMYANSAAKPARAVSEAERYMAIPSQALAYKVGQLKIRELRTRAEEALGAAFNVKDFHSQVLDDGAVPLSVLEHKINRWIREETLSAGMTLSGEKLRARLIGNTLTGYWEPEGEPVEWWEYEHPDGRAIWIDEFGERVEGRWEIRDDGCSFTDYGEGEAGSGCYYYLDNGDGTLTAIRPNPNDPPARQLILEGDTKGLGTGG